MEVYLSKQLEGKIVHCLIKHNIIESVSVCLITLHLHSGIGCRFLHIKVRVGTFRPVYLYAFRDS